MPSTRADRAMSSSSLGEQLSEIYRRSCEMLPTPQVAVLRRAVELLRRSGIQERCLQPGETAPAFSFIDQHNRPSTLYSLCDDGPVIISFFRGFWCPFCRTELAAYEEHLDEITALGATYLTVSPHRQQEEASAPYASICDCDNQISRGFGLLYTLQEEERALFREWGVALDEINPSGRWELPVPAVYIVGTDRVVLYHFVDVDYRRRLPPEELIEELKALR